MTTVVILELDSLSNPSWHRLFHIYDAIKAGIPFKTIHDRTRIDIWFLKQIEDMILTEKEVEKHTLDTIPRDLLFEAKQKGYADRQVAHLLGCLESEVYRRRTELGIKRVYKLVDTCAGEFPAKTPYYYSTFEEENESVRSDRKKIVVLGSGPNRIGQGIEFDYCCVRACTALADLGYETIMVNCNPETVSTDFDTADVLYFEPLTLEDVLEVCEREQPLGVIVQLGGQTPLKLAAALENAGVRVLGTSVADIQRAEDRRAFQDTLKDLGVVMPRAASAETLDEACAAASEIGFPVLVRPSFVLGGRGMVVAYDEEFLRPFLQREILFGPGNPLEIVEYLEDAFEYDVDAVCDGKRTVVAGVMQHIEEAGVHSGDSSCTLPPFHAPPALMLHSHDITERLAAEFAARGFTSSTYT
ncbi:MAG: carbamoyl-phosphate synthase large subunit, partial [Flavobacteriales bacterium]|nr:carbamoyl-phosphate synthase large subunit [Flavobacteriales bacterium]